MSKNKDTSPDQNTAIYQVKANNQLSPTEYLIILQRFSKFIGFFEDVTPFLPYPKTSPICTLKEKLLLAKTTETAKPELELTYSEIVVLKNSIKAILTLLKTCGVKTPRKASGAIADDIVALENHFFYLSNDDNEMVISEPDAVDPFSDWLHTNA
ncbi:hypothetical protein [Limnospira fusiformis]|uniref:hypothetical protein n=1 Tax=Limnospira fusiformis TaxID=54297 RepID=UPI0001E2A66A